MQAKISSNFKVFRIAEKVLIYLCKIKLREKSLFYPRIARRTEKVLKFFCKIKKVFEEIRNFLVEISKNRGRIESKNLHFEALL